MGIIKKPNITEAAPKINTSTNFWKSIFNHFLFMIIVIEPINKIYAINVIGIIIESYDMNWFVKRLL